MLKPRLPGYERGPDAKKTWFCSMPASGLLIVDPNY